MEWSAVDSPDIDGVGPISSVTPLRGGWSTSRTLLVQGTEGFAVLKRWDLESQSRARAEAASLQRLHEAGLSIAPEPRRVNGSFVAQGPRDEMWTAAEYVRGEHPTGPSTNRNRARLAQLIAQFHISVESDSSRLVELLEPWRGFLEPPAAEMVDTARRAVSGLVPSALELPRAHVHGDMNHGNLIETSSGLRVIDHEFARIDVRMLEFASLRVPNRTTAGELAVVSREYQNDVIREYGGRSPLDDEETRLLPSINLMYLLLIARDLCAQGDSALSRIRSAVQAVLLEVLAEDMNRL